MDFRLPPAGHFVNVSLEEYKVKLSFFSAKFAQSFAAHDPSSAGMRNFFCILCDISAPKNRKYKPE
jgi:hypothetical protein